MTQRYRVCAPYVANIPTGQAALLAGGASTRTTVAVMAFSQGQVLPDDVSQEHLDHLLRNGLVEPVEEAE